MTAGSFVSSYQWNNDSERRNSADDVDIIGEVGVNGGQGKRGGEGKLLTVARPPLIHGCLARVGKLF